MDLQTFFRLYPYLKEIEKKYPVSWFPAIGSRKGYQGMAGGTRYDPGTKKEILLALGQEPEEEIDSRRHEGTHAAIEESPNWRYIMSLLGLDRTVGLGHEIGMDYFHPDVELRHQLWVEEMMNRFLATTGNPYRDREDELLTETQQSLLPYLLQHSKYGPQAGSIWGPELPEEYEGKKGGDIYHGTVFHPYYFPSNVTGR